MIKTCTPFKNTVYKLKKKHTAPPNKLCRIQCFMYVKKENKTLIKKICIDSILDTSILTLNYMHLENFKQIPIVYLTCMYMNIYITNTIINIIIINKNLIKTYISRIFVFLLVGILTNSISGLIIYQNFSGIFFKYITIMGLSMGILTNGRYTILKLIESNIYITNIHIIFFRFINSFISHLQNYIITKYFIGY